ncbi:MAG: hypothetical protein CBB68_08785 [Rhodospirillaceae bacterium TMED8]|nr:NADPH-dependent oxidoreductase [Magnetovibrio sp.]OUT50458.1 MAG: hypothetical protein CBB68_08785 [Rhodospirillaceae bacterium TMED8]|tara:strand:- start:3577 stop:4407 length:831 start_codon:yes stop_codon:yes gene_type:complete
MYNAKSLMRDRYGLDIDLAVKITPTMEGMLLHRSCRAYTGQDIDEGLLNVLLACAQSAPSKSNLQQYSIVVVRDADRRAAIAKLVPGLLPWFETAPIFLCFLGDLRRIRRLAKLRSRNYQNNNSDTFMNACVDAGLAMQNFVTAAESAGLGTCPISMIRDQIAMFADILQLPNGVFPIAGLTIGWPKNTGVSAVRLPASTVVHREVYNDANLEADIEEYDLRAHERKPIEPDGQRLKDIFGEVEICTWSDNVTRQLSEPERPLFREFLRSRGIHLS